MKRTRTARIFAAALAVIMMFAMLPASAFADNNIKEIAAARTLDGPMTVRGVVTCAYGGGLFIQDSTGSIYVGCTSLPTGITRGMTVEASGICGKYNNEPAIVSASVSVSSGIALTAEETTVSALGGFDSGRYVKLNGLEVVSVKGAEITLKDSGDNEVILNNSALYVLEPGQKINVSAAVFRDGGKVILMNSSASEIVRLTAGGTTPGADGIGGGSKAGKSGSVGSRIANALSAVEGGESVVIYSAAAGAAVGSASHEEGGKFSLTPVDAIIGGDTLAYGEGTAVFSVINKGEGKFSFRSASGYLSLTGDGAKLIGAEDDTTLFTLESVSGGYKLVSTKNQGLCLEYRNTLFTASDDSGTGSPAVRFFKVNTPAPSAPAAPVADVEPGEVGKNTELNFTAEDGAKIFYKTTEGYTEYTGTLTISQDTTYIVYAERAGLKSEEAVFAYTVRKGAAVAGGSYVIFNEANSALGYSVGTESGSSMNAVKTVIKSGYAIPENGARIFEVGSGEDEYIFFTSGGKYLTANDSEDLFLTDVLNEYGLWTLTELNGSYLITNKAAKIDEKELSLEYHDGSFFAAAYKEELASVFELDFYPVTEDVTVVGGIVRDPCVKISGNPSRYITEDYQGTFTVEDTVGELSSVAVGFINAAGELEAVTYTDNKNGSYSFTIGADKLDGLGDSFTVEVVVVNGLSQRYIAKKTVENVDKPYIVSLKPADRSVTGGDDHPLIEIKIKNMGEEPLISMVVNGKEIPFPKYGYNTEDDGATGVITYQSESPYPDGRVAVMLCVQRKDGVQINKAFAFTVGTSAYQHFYGQLNGTTALSDPKLGYDCDDVIDALNSTEPADNVDFISVADKAVSFDKGSTPNPVEAIGNAGAATPESRAAWADYTGTAEQYNYDQNMKVALVGYEIEWPDGVGHITTYNSKGVVSTKNPELSTTGGYVGLTEYYSAIASEYGQGTVSQFNSGANTGDFNSFAYCSPERDSRMALIEVTAPDGKIGKAEYENYVLALDRGWHVSPVSTRSDMTPGWEKSFDTRDVVVTADFSKDGLLEAMNANSVYVTEDKNLEIDFSASIGGVSFMMGQSAEESEGSNTVNISVSDADGEKIAAIELIGNNGEVVKTWSNPTDTVMCNIEDGKYSYYFVRVTEQDGDVALTSPIWVGDSDRIGIADVTCTTAYPVTGEELKLNVEYFNDEGELATIRKVDYEIDGEVIATDDEPHIILAVDKTMLPFRFTPEEARTTTVDVIATIELDGREIIRTKSVTVDIADAEKLLYIGVDESHNNALGEDNTDIFGDLARENDLRVVYIETKEQLLEALNDPKYSAMVFSAPVNVDAAESQTDNIYLPEELAAIERFNANGGALIVTGTGDGADISGKTQTSQIQNSLLYAVGSRLRLSDNTVTDEFHNGETNEDLYFSSYDFDSFLTKGIVTDSSHLSDYDSDGAHTQFYSQNGGSSVYCVDAALKPMSEIVDNVSPAVYSLSSAESSDKDSDDMTDIRYPYNSRNALLALASEKRVGKGLVLVSGGSFIGNESMRSDAGKKTLSNVTICENLFGELNPVEVTPIGAVNRQTAGGYKYTVEGVVTSNSYTYDNETGFTDCIYVQDSTGGIRCVNVPGSYKVGDKLRISGSNTRLNGESTLKVNNVEIVSSNNEVQPKQIKATEGFANTGSLVSFDGYVTKVVRNDSGLVTDIIAQDSTNRLMRISIDENITPEKTIENLREGVSVRATGIESYDNTYNTAEGGPFERIRVRDRDDVVCSDHEHEYVWVETVKATCTVDGYRTGTCNCGDTKIETVKATGHDWSEWVITRNPTAYTSGSKQRICGNCGAIEFQKIPPTKNPKTGDGEMLLVWMLAADIALAAGTSFAVYAKKRRNGISG